MESTKDFKKVLNYKDILFLSFGAMIGWGWVILVGNWIMTAGSIGAIIAFIIGGILIIFIGLVYSELTSAIPTTGGEMTFCYKALGFQFAFFTSWFILLGYLSVISFEAIALPMVIRYLFPNYEFIFLYNISNNPIFLSWILVSVIGSIIIYSLNYIGIKFAAKIQNILTVIIFIVGFLLFIGSFMKGDLLNFKPLFIDNFKGVFKVFLITPFMFVGFNVIPQVAKEINLPSKKIGLMLIISIFLAAIWYILIIFSVSYIVNINQIAKSSLITADAMRIIYNSSLASNILIFGGIFGIITTWNAFYIGCSRIIYTMSKIGMLPKFLTKLHPKYNTPTNTLTFILIATLVPSFFGKNMIYWLSNVGSFGIIIAYLFVSISFLILRKKEPKLIRPFKVKNGFFIGTISVLFCLFFLILIIPGSPISLIWPYEWLILIIWFTFGFLLYFYSIKKYTKQKINQKVESIIK